MRFRIIVYTHVTMATGSMCCYQAPTLQLLTLCGLTTYHMSAPRDDQLARPVVAQLANHWAGSTEITNM